MVIGDLVIGNAIITPLPIPYSPLPLSHSPVIPVSQL
jgi:hypothetical protein